jgi:hypothetical protein
MVVTNLRQNNNKNLFITKLNNTTRPSQRPIDLSELITMEVWPHVNIKERIWSDRKVTSKTLVIIKQHNSIIKRKRKLFFYKSQQFWVLRVIKLKTYFVPTYPWLYLIRNYCCWLRRSSWDCCRSAFDSVHRGAWAHVLAVLMDRILLNLSLVKLKLWLKATSWQMRWKTFSIFLSLSRW